MKTFYREFALLINIIYWLPMFMSMAVAIVVAWFVGSHFKIKKAYKTIISLLAACAVSLFWIIPVEKAERQRIAKYNERKEKYEEAKAVFDKQCKKAGEKIYRTVDNVDGVMLLKVRPTSALHKNDYMFEDAAIVGGRESAEHGYIASFLYRYAIRNTGSVKKGYKFVDVLKEDGSITRYLDFKHYGSFMQDQDGVIINPDNPARYAVTYENNVEPELRKHWVAGTTIKIIDRQTNELLAEKTIFAFARTMGNYVHGAWFDSRMDTCPEYVGIQPTAHFTVTVLKP